MVGIYGTFKLNKVQINKLRTKAPALFDEVVDGKRVPIEFDDLYMVVPNTPADPVEIRYTQHLESDRYLGDITFEAAWRL